jgi:putative PEP-CTERM system TPR-repeat lipoprotein
MKPNRLVLALALAGATLVLPGCDNTSKLTVQEHIQRAKDFEDQGNLKGSVIELKNAIQKNPENAQTRLLLGQIYLKSGFGAEAEKELLASEKLGVSRDALAPLLGEAWLLTGNYKRVLDELQDKDTLSPINRSRIVSMRANALFKIGKFREACALFENAHSLHTGVPQVYWGLAQCAIAERKMPEARQWLDKAFALEDRQAETLIFIGDLEQLNQQPQQAVSAYQQAVKLQPDNLAALQSLATLQIMQGDAAEAQPSIDAIQKIAPNSIFARYILALQKFHQGQYTDANNLLLEIFRTNPEHLPSILLAGYTAYALNSLEQAETYLNRYLQHFPNNLYALRALAATQIRQGRPEKALATLTPLLPPRGNDAPALAIASLAYARNAPGKSDELLKQAILMQPDNAAFRTQLGLSKLSLGEPDSAIEDLESARKLQPTRHQAAILLALTHIRNEHYDQALEVSRQLEKQLPQNPLPLDLQGRALLGQKDFANARSRFEQALKIDPTFLPSIGGLASLELRDNKPQAAQALFTRLLEVDKNNLRAMMAMAEIAALTNDETNFVQWLNRAVSAHPEALPPNSTLVHYHMIKQQPRKALEIAKTLADRRPNDAQVLGLLGETQLTTGDANNAIATYNKAISNNPRAIGAYLGLARAQNQAKQAAAARDTLRRALKLDPSHPQIRIALTQTEAQMGNFEAALKIAHQIQHETPQSVLGYELEGDVLNAQKRYSDAATVYGRALSHRKTSALLIKQHRAERLAGGGAASQKQMTEWLRLNPKDSDVRFALAEFAMVSGNDREAIQHYEVIQRENPPNAAVLNNLALLYHRARDPRAIATAEQAYKLAPNSAPVLDTLGWILLQNNQTDRARDLLRKAFTAAPKSPSIHYHYAAALGRAGDKAGAVAELQRLLANPAGFAEREEARALLLRLQNRAE